MARSTFQGPVRSLNGFYTQGPGTVVNITGNTTLTVADHAGKILRVNSATATITLPIVNANADAVGTGPGSDPNTLNNVGTTFVFFIETASTSAKIITGTAADALVGNVELGTSGGTSSTFVPAAGNRAINLNGTTTGGIVGSFIQVTILTTNKVLVQGTLIGSGVLATPFAAS